MPRPLRPFLALALGLAAGVAGAQDERRMAVIVHPERRVELTVDELAQIYLRRKQFWPNGEVIVPLNLASGLPQRALFSQRVLRQTEVRLADYWNRRYFDGVMPPATLASTAAVRRYVAADRRAIGYVPADEVNASVRVILVLER